MHIRLRKLAALAALVFCAPLAQGQEPTLNIFGGTTGQTLQTLQLTAHPRVTINSTIAARSLSVSGPAPKAVSGNPPYYSMTTQAAAIAANADCTTNFNFANFCQDGQVVMTIATAWGADQNGPNATNYLRMATYMITQMNFYVGYQCSTSVLDCMATSEGNDQTSYGTAYWMSRWISAYEIIRGTLTTTQRQTFADMMVNDLSVPAGTGWCPAGTATNCGGTGLGGSVATSCVNPTQSSGSITVTVNSSGVMTASAPFFGSTGTSAGDLFAMAAKPAYNGVIVTVTDSTHATIESDKWSLISGYSGIVYTIPGTWANGDCGWFWSAKNNVYNPYSIIQSPTLYPTGSGEYGGENGGGLAGTGNENLTISAVFGEWLTLLSIADDDVNFSARTSVEWTALFNGWYNITYLPLYEKNYNGPTTMGEVYGIWRAVTFTEGPIQAFDNSFVSPPNLLGNWSQNLIQHAYMTALPACASQSLVYGQSYDPSSSFSFMPDPYGMAMLIQMYNGTSEGENLNYWMQNIWQQCTNYDGQNGTIPGTDLMWTNAGMLTFTTGGYNNNLNDSQAWWYLLTDSNYPQATLSAIPTGYIENTADDGGINSGGTPMSMMISRTGYTAITDRMIEMHALYRVPGNTDHDYPSKPTGSNSGYCPGDIRIFAGSYMMTNDSPAGPGSYNGGGGYCNMEQIAGDGQVTTNAQFPFVDKMPWGHADNNYVSALTDNTLSYISAAHVSGAHRHGAHLKKGGTQDVFFVLDDTQTSVATSIQFYNHFNQGAVTPPYLVTGGSTTLSGNQVTETYPGLASISHVDATQLFATYFSATSGQSVRVYTNNANGTYPYDAGYSWRTTTCLAATGAGTSLTLTSVAASSGGSAVYTGAITGGASNALAGVTVNIVGFTNAPNNGAFRVTASTTTTLTLTTAVAVAETDPATATIECNANLTSAQFATVYIPMVGNGNTPVTPYLLTTIDANHIGMEADVTGTAKVYVAAAGTSTFNTASFTTGAYSGLGDIEIDNMTPGNYTITAPSGSTSCTATATDPSCYVETTAGSVLLSASGGSNYTITATNLPSIGGSLASTGGCTTACVAGTAYTITATAASGYSFTSFTSTCGGSYISNVYSGNMPSSNCTVQANYTLIPPPGYSQVSGATISGGSIH